MEQNFTSSALPGTGAVGTGYPWSNPSRITADDGSSATFFPGGSTTGSIVGSVFDINLPDEAVIDGLEIYIDGSQASAASTIEINAAGTSSKVAVMGGSNGGATDLWGASSISIAQLAALTTTITTEAFGAPGNASIDCLILTVHWHLDLSVPVTDVPTRIDYKSYSKDGTYLGLLPNVTSLLALSQDINSGGSSINVVCAKYITEEITDVEAILDNNSDPLLTESDEEILAHTTTDPFAVGDSDDDALYKNGNRIKVWIYNYWHPNGKLVFSGQVNKVSFSYGAETTVELLVHSDGLDLSQNLVIPVSSFSLTPDVSQTTQSTFTTVQASTTGAPIKGPTSWTYVAQSFVAGAIARIGAIDLLLEGFGDLTLSLSIGGSNVFLGSVTQSVSAGSPTVTRISFNTPIDVTPGGLLVFTVTVPLFTSIKVYRSTSSVYANGNGFLASSGGYVGQAWDLYFVTQSASIGETTVTYTSDDPITQILSSVLADYNTRGGIITERDFEATGLSLTYTFNQDTIFDAIRKMLELAPAGWYSYIDLGTADIDVLSVSGTADFTIVKGRDLNIAKFAFSIENLKNNLFFSGGDAGLGDNLYNQYQDTESIGNFGVRSASKSDERVTLTATADAIGNSFIDENSGETQETSITIFNNHVDITQFTPGKTIGFRNFGAPFDDMVLQIVRREPNFSTGLATLTLGRLPIALSSEIQRLNKGLLVQQTIANPDSPS